MVVYVISNSDPSGARHNWSRCSQRRRGTAAAIGVGLTLVLGAGCRSTPRPDSAAAQQAPARGGELLVSIRTEPRSFNRHAARDTSTDLVSSLTQARLVRIDQATQAVEPWLAEGWTTADEGTRVTMTLKRGLVFSDGQPFTADDVVFAFQAVYDERSGSALADTLKAGGKKLQVAALDPHTVVITFPAPFAPGLRILDNLPILPAIGSRAALEAGTFTKAWGLDTPPSDLVGLGPFVLRQYVPGAASRLRAQPALLRPGGRRHARCRTWIVSSSRSFRIRARSCCAWSRGSST